MAWESPACFGMFPKLIADQLLQILAVTSFPANKIIMMGTKPLLCQHRFPINLRHGLRCRRSATRQTSVVFPVKYFHLPATLFNHQVPNCLYECLPIIPLTTIGVFFQSICITLSFRPKAVKRRWLQYYTCHPVTLVSVFEKPRRHRSRTMSILRLMICVTFWTYWKLISASLSFLVPKKKQRRRSIWLLACNWESYFHIS
jgi:hypothetical protein